MPLYVMANKACPSLGVHVQRLVYCLSVLQDVARYYAVIGIRKGVCICSEQHAWTAFGGPQWGCMFCNPKSADCIAAPATSSRALDACKDAALTFCNNAAIALPKPCEPMQGAHA